MIHAAHKCFTISVLKCQVCGNEFPIPRIRKRKNGHLKNLYCIKCGRRTKHRETGECKDE